MQHGLHGRAVAAALAVVLSVTFVASDVAQAAVEPVVPGFYRLRDEAKNAKAAELGQLLIGELNCTACHAAPANSARVAAKGAPDLSTIGARATPQWIRKYLSEPHKVKPGATMPDLFFASEPGARAGAVDFLTNFLAAQGGPMPASNIEGTTVLVDTGRKLYHSIGCVACHSPEEKIKDEVVPSVPHGELASKYTVDSLAAFLLDPTKARPEARMPSLHLSTNEATALAAYLLRDQLNNPKLADAPPLRTRGLKYELYENTHFPTVELQKFAAVKPTATGSCEVVSLKDLPIKNHNDYGLKFTGLIAIPRDGKYTFRLNSDDGSRLYVDDAEIINNDGLHPPQEKTGEVELHAGDHTLAVTYTNQIAGDALDFAWEGPGVARQPVPADVLFKIGGRAMIPLDADDTFKPDPQKVAIGGRMFAAMGCANCHQMEGLKGTRPAKPLAELKDVSAGCLAEHPAKGLPNYELSEEQRAFIGEALTDAKSLSAPLEGESLVTRTLAEMNCLACHKRGDLGGVTKDRKTFFTMLKPFDMGEEGNIPPKLTNVGNKLKPTAMEQIIFEGKLHVRRHHMATRMPQFVKAKMGQFVAGVQKVDSDKQERPARDPRRLARRRARRVRRRRRAAGESLARQVLRRRRHAQGPRRRVQRAARDRRDQPAAGAELCRVEQPQPAVADAEARRAKRRRRVQGLSHGQSRPGDVHLQARRDRDLRVADAGVEKRRRGAGEEVRDQGRGGEGPDVPRGRRHQDRGRRRRRRVARRRQVDGPHRPEAATGRPHEQRRSATADPRERPTRLRRRDGLVVRSTGDSPVSFAFRPRRNTGETPVLRTTSSSRRRRRSGRSRG
jgi:cbb3-type cytochrome oxidase cytochrome c subunit